MIGYLEERRQLPMNIAPVYFEGVRKKIEKKEEAS